MTEVRLRAIAEADATDLFEMMRDPVAVRMAAFTSPDPDDPDRFARWFDRLLTTPGNRAFAVLAGGAFAGMAGSFSVDGEREVTYWIDRVAWGRGIATAALAQLLDQEPVRPLSARVAAGNLASQRVLRSAGFVEVGRGSGFAEGVGAEVEEVLFLLR